MKQKNKKYILALVLIFFVAIAGIISINQSANSVNIQNVGLDISDYTVLTDNSASNKLMISSKDKSVIKKLKGITDIVTTDDVIFLTFNNVKNSDLAYETLKENNATVNKDVLLEMQADNVNGNIKRITNNTSGKKVAVIDTGVNGADTAYDTTGEGLEDKSGHGTTVASIIQDNLEDKANIISIKALNSEGKGSIASVYTAIKIAIEQKVDIINLSATSGYKIDGSLLAEAIKEAESKGITVVTAAGNYSTDTKDFSTANVEEAVVVSAVNENGDFASYSNYGKTVDYSALGSYEDYSGTSVAAARVTAQILKHGLKNIEKYGVDLGATGYDIYYGNATFDVEAKEGMIPTDYFESIIFHADWKKLSDSEFKKLVENARESMLSVWLNSLSKKELEIVLAKDTILSHEHYSLDSSGNKKNTMLYAEYLLGFDIKDMESVAIIDKLQGFFTLYIRDYGSQTSYTTKYAARVHAKISSKDSDKTQAITWSFTAANSNTGNATNSISLGLQTANKANGINYTTASEKGNYTILSFDFKYAKPAYRYTTEIVTLATNSSGKPANAAFYSNSTLNNKGVLTASATENMTIKANAINLGMNAMNDDTYGHGTYVLNMYQPKLTINYNANGGTDAPSAQTVYYNNRFNITNTVPKRNGYIFNSWGTRASAESSIYVSGYSTTPDYLHPFTSGTKFTTNTTTLYALWKNADYTLSFNANGGVSDEITPVTVTYNKAVPKVKMTTREGCKFKGWYNTPTETSASVQVFDKDGNPNLSTTYIDKNGNWINAGDVTLYALWETKNGTVYYHSNAKSGENKEDVISFSVSSANITPAKINMFQNTGYAFIGWSEKAKAENESDIINEGASLGHFPDINDESNITELHLYAQWIKADYYDGILFENKYPKSDPPALPEYDQIAEALSFEQSVTIKKEDEDSYIVPGVTFNVKCNDGTEDTCVTDENGVAKAVFSYTVSTEDISQDASGDYWYCSNYEKLSETDKQKVISDGYYISEAEARASAIKDIQDYIKTIEKKYEIIEVSHPDYVNTAENQYITLKGDGASDEITIIDTLNIQPYTLQNSCELTPVFKIRKTDALKKPIPGVKINIYSDPDKIHLLLSGTTDEKGEISYIGETVKYSTGEYKYVDVAEYGQASERLQEYCDKNGYYSSYAAALEAYKKDKNYAIVTGIEEDYEDKGINMYASREKEMERTYYYEEVEAKDGYVLDNTLHSQTVFWFTSNDIYQNILTNDNKEDPFDAEKEGEPDETLTDTYPDDYVDPGEDEPVASEGTDGDNVDYAVIFVNYQNFVLKDVSYSDKFTQTLIVNKVGTLGNKLPGAVFDAMFNGIKETYTTDENGQFIIKQEFTVKSLDEYYYIENHEYVSESDIQKIIATSTDKVHIFKMKEEAYAAAKAEVENMYDIKYKLSEKEAPAGYKLCDNVEVTLHYSETKEITITDENVASIRIIKNDSSNRPMPNALFAFYTTDETYKDSQPYEYKGTNYYLIEEKNTNEAGEIKLGNLKADEKYLAIEKQTVSGKVLLSEPINIGKLPSEMEQKPGSDYQGTVINKGGKYYYYDVTYTVTNDNLFIMPKTGVSKTYYYLFGLVIAGLGIFIGFHRTKKKRGVLNDK